MKTLIILAVAAFSAISNTPNLQSFDMKDPKDVSGLSFYIDSPLEPIFGQTNDISGTININHSDLTKSSATITVQTAGLETASPDLTAAMQGEWCLNPEKYPTITFATTKIENIKKEGDVINAKVTGDFTWNGVTKPLTTNATLTIIPNGNRARGGDPADLVILRTKFTVKRLDHKVAPTLGLMKIGNNVEVQVAFAGVSK